MIEARAASVASIHSYMTMAQPFCVRIWNMDMNAYKFGWNKKVGDQDGRNERKKMKKKRKKKRGKKTGRRQKKMLLNINQNGKTEELQMLPCGGLK